MKKLLLVLLSLFLCSTAYAEVQKLRSVQLSATGAVKATPGVFYGISGRVTAAAGRVHVSDGASGDTDDVIFTQGVAVDEDRIYFFAPNGIDCSETGIWLEIDGGAVVTIYFQ